MISLAQLSRLGPLLLGLFLLAQAAAIGPLLSANLQHAFENVQDAAADLAEGGKVHHVHHHHARHDGGRHEHGNADPSDQCCMLYNHLVGVLPIAGGEPASDLTTAIAQVASRSPSGTLPVILERPPKPPLPI